MGEGGISTFVFPPNPKQGLQDGWGGWGGAGLWIGDPWSAEQQREVSGSSGCQVSGMLRKGGFSVHLEHLAQLWSVLMLIVVAVGC